MPLVHHRDGRGGHDVEVVTSCACDYVDWANVYPADTSQIDGVTVHRLRVSRPRAIESFNRLSGAVRHEPELVPWDRQQRWLAEQGPHLPDLEPWLRYNYERFDAVVVFTYLYFTAPMALRAGSRGDDRSFSTRACRRGMAIALVALRHAVSAMRRHRVLHPGRRTARS